MEILPQPIYQADAVLAAVSRGGRPKPRRLLFGGESR